MDICSSHFLPHSDLMLEANQMILNQSKRIHRCRSPPSPAVFDYHKKLTGGRSMKYWQKDRNYRKYQNEDGTSHYVITVDGVDVEVSFEVYQAYAQADRKERYGYECEEGLVISLDRMAEDGVPLVYLTGQHVESAEDAAIRDLMIKQMMDVMLLLSEEERKLIDQLFFQSISARELARTSGVYHRTIIYRRDKILEKLRRLMSE